MSAAQTEIAVGRELLTAIQTITQLAFNPNSKIKTKDILDFEEMQITGESDFLPDKENLFPFYEATFNELAGIRADLPYRHSELVRNMQAWSDNLLAKIRESQPQAKLSNILVDEKLCGELAKYLDDIFKLLPTHFEISLPDAKIISQFLRTLLKANATEIQTLVHKLLSQNWQMLAEAEALTAKNYVTDSFLR